MSERKRTHVLPPLREAESRGRSAHLFSPAGVERFWTPFTLLLCEPQKEPPMRSPAPETSFKHLVLLSLSLLLFGSAARAENPPPLPSGDKPGSADLPFVRRFAGSIILSYERKSLDEVSWPLSRLEWVPGQKDTHNNDLAAPKKTKDATGERTTSVYVAPRERSSMEIIGSYRDQITAQKGKVLFECKGEGCGAKSTGNSLGGGGR